MPGLWTKLKLNNCKIFSKSSNWHQLSDERWQEGFASSCSENSKTSLTSADSSSSPSDSAIKADIFRLVLSLTFGLGSGEETGDTVSVNPSLSRSFKLATAGCTGGSTDSSEETLGWKETILDDLFIALLQNIAGCCCSVVGRRWRW